MARSFLLKCLWSENFFDIILKYNVWNTQFQNLRCLRYKLLILRVGKVELFHLQKWSGDWNRIYWLWRQFVCSGLFTPCYWKEIQRLRKCQVIRNRIVSPIFGVVLMKILWRTMRMMLKKVLTHKLTSRVVSRDVLTARFKCHFWGENGSTLRARKINNFYRRHPKFWNCVFQTLYFHIM